MSKNSTHRGDLPGWECWGELYPFDAHYFSVDAGRMHYVDVCTTGEVDPPVLLFVHGNPTWSFHWRRIILAQCETYRCVAPDHLGCGMSDLTAEPLRLADRIDHLSELVESLDLRRVTLVAQDWGGAIGLGSVLRMRDRFERIVLFNTGAFPPWYIPWRIRVCRWPIVGRLALQGANLFSRAALRMTRARSSCYDRRVEQAYLAPYHSWKERQAVYQFVRDIPLSERHPSWATLAAIEAGLPSLSDMPIQLIWGMRDWCFTPACLEKFCQFWPQAEVHRLEDVGHWVVEDAPDEAARLLAQWLDQHSLVERR